MSLIFSEIFSMEDTGDTEVISCFIFYCWSVNFDWSFLFMKSWTNKVFFFSSNSISFILLTRANFLYIHTGNELEEVLEDKEKKERKLEAMRIINEQRKKKNSSSSSSSSSSWWRWWWWWWYRRWWWGWQWGWWRWWCSVVDHQTSELERLYAMNNYLI